MVWGLFLKCKTKYAYFQQMWAWIIFVCRFCQSNAVDSRSLMRQSPILSRFCARAKVWSSCCFRPRHWARENTAKSNGFKPFSTCCPWNDTLERWWSDSFESPPLRRHLIGKIVRTASKLAKHSPLQLFTHSGFLLSYGWSNRIDLNGVTKQMNPCWGSGTFSAVKIAVSEQ